MWIALYLASTCTNLQDSACLYPLQGTLSILKTSDSLPCSQLDRVSFLSDEKKRFVLSVKHRDQPQTLTHYRLS